MLRVLYLVALAAMLFGSYHTFGPGLGRSELPDDLEWWRAWGFADAWGLFGERGRDDRPGGWLPLVLVLPAAAMIAAGTLLFRSALARTLIWVPALTIGIFVWYGYQSPGVWRFFGWRFPLVALSLTSIVSVILFAPSLLRGLLRVSIALAGLALALVFTGIFLLSTEVTGTSPWMRFNISPWPVVSLYGLLLVGSWLAAVHGAAGLGSWLAGRLGGGGGIALGALAAAAVGGALSLVVFGELGALTTGGIVAVSVAYAIWCRIDRPDEPRQAARDALVRLAVGAFLFLAIQLGNEAAKAYQITARNVTATQVLVALEAYKEVEGTYPDRLRELVPEYFDELPQPRIGLLRDERDSFTYSNFGDSYALEFASVQWVQCGYSPPFEYASFEDEEEEDEELESWEEDAPDVASRPDADELALRAMLAERGLNGSWNCAETPPKLW